VSPAPEPEVALAFSADPWVEVLHRHLSDHGGARVRTVVVEAEIALEESYDVLVSGHRWPGLTQAVVADVHARGRSVLGVHDVDEPASRRHLLALGVDAVIESDAHADAFVRAIVQLRAPSRPASNACVAARERRSGRLVVVGGAPGTGRTEVAIQLAVALNERLPTVLLDGDDVAPAIAARLQLPIEPNLRTAIDAVEHGLGELGSSLTTEGRKGLRVLTGLPTAAAWSHVRPSEVIRVCDRLACDDNLVVADGAGSLEAIIGVSRGRNGVARALVREADGLVAVCDASPNGVGRLLAWVVEARTLAPATPMIVVVNRAPNERFRRGELYDEINANLPVVDALFVAHDARVASSAWDGTVVPRGAFTRALDAVAAQATTFRRRTDREDALEVAS
jgi:hypothetical protein